MMALVRTVTLVAALGATCAYAADIGYLAPPGVPAKEFPSPQRPVAQIVSPSGSGVAQDVTRNYLIELAKRTERLKLTNVTFALGEPHDPRLPASSLDAAILVHMYHEISQPYAFRYNLAPALKAGARVGIVDLEP